MSTQPSLFPNSSPRNPAPLADICRRKHKGNERSEAANRLVHATKNSARERIYSLIAASAGITLKEIAKKFKKHIHQISGRISELKKANKIYETGEVRDGCAVLKVKQ